MPNVKFVNCNIRCTNTVLDCNRMSSQTIQLLSCQEFFHCLIEAHSVISFDFNFRGRLLRTGGGVKIACSTFPGNSLFK